MTTEATESTQAEPKPSEKAAQVPAAAQAKPNESQTGSEPDWLPKRLEQASRSAANAVLSSLGFENEEAAKAALAELKTLRESQMSEQERIQARLAELEPAATKAATLEQTVKTFAERAVASLTESQRDAVQRLTGGEPSKVLDAIEALRPTWQAQGTTASTAAPAEPKSTTASAGPPDTGTSSEPDIRSTFKESKNPFRRASIVSQYAPQLIDR